MSMLEDVEIEKVSDSRRSAVYPNGIDTLVVPARKEGFERVFLGENRWYAVRLRASMCPLIKFVAVYQVAPIKAITHIATVSSIEPWDETDKFVVNFAGKARQIGPIPLLKGGRVKPLWGLRYARKAKLDAAKTLDDVW